MSHEGILKRGLKWYSQRNLEGNLPEGITNDPAKMEDVKYYLDNKPVDKQVDKSISKKGK